MERLGLRAQKAKQVLRAFKGLWGPKGRWAHQVLQVQKAKSVLQGLQGCRGSKAGRALLASKVVQERQAKKDRKEHEVL